MERLNELDRYIIDPDMSESPHIRYTARTLAKARAKACTLVNPYYKDRWVGIRDSKHLVKKNRFEMGYELVEKIAYTKGAYCMKKCDASVWDTNTIYRISPTTGEIIKG